jgi:WD40 repeat protein/tRNA A-37 threonylcarbamoyl transferase component Bud32
MSLERWSRVQALYLEAEALPQEARSDFLENSCGGDSTLRAEVESLLQSSQATRGVFERADPSVPAEPAGPALPAGTRLGHWSIDSLIGRGGMGEVYAARRADGAFELRVAIKLLKRGLDSDALVARFGRERRILAQLDHPNIAHVLDAGVAVDGRPFLAMEFVEGKPITEYARSETLPTAAVLRLMITACEAVQAAHAKRIVHRDLKPSNLLVSHQGQVKLLDFGIAKLLAEEDAQLTRLAGEATSLTPAYAAPEQLLGRDASPATDVYALGVILYLLLAERLPHQRSGRSIREIELSLSRETIESPSLVLRRERGLLPERQRLERLHAVSRDLDLIVLKALHAEPLRRYASAQGLADDLRRLLENRPVLARRDSLAYRAGRFVRRNRRTLAQLCTVLAAAAVVAVAVISHQSHKEHLRRLVALGREQLATQHAGRAAAYFSAAYSQGDESVDVRFALARAMPAVDAMMAWSIGYPSAEYLHVSHSPDAASVLITDQGQGTPFATVWDVGKRVQKYRLPGTPALVQADYSRDAGRVLLAGSATYMAGKPVSQVWDLHTGLKLFEVPGSTGPGDTGPNPVFVAADPDVTRVLAISPEGKAQVWDVASKQKLLTLDASGSAVSAAFSRDGSRIVTGSDDGTVTLWDAANGAVQSLIHAKPAGPTTAFFSGGDKFVVTASQSGVLHLWDAATGEWQGSPGGADGPLIFAGLDADGRRLASLAAGQSSFKVWDLATQQLIPHSFSAGADYYGNFRFQPGGDGLLTPSTDGTRVWSRSGEELNAILETNDEETSAADYSPDGARILTAANDGKVQMWDARQLRGEPSMMLPHARVMLQGQTGPFWALYTPDGKRIVSGGTDNEVRVWDAADGRPLTELRGHGGPVFAGSLSPDGKLLATGSYDKTARIWDLESGKTLAVLEGHTAIVKPVFSPDGELLATTARFEPTHDTRIWEVRSGKLLATLQGDFDIMRTMNFSPDGRRLVTAHRDAAARIWDTRSGKLLATLNGGAGAVWTALFSPDGSRVLSISQGRSAQLWNAADGRLLKRLDQIGFEPHTGIFNQAGDVVAIGGGVAALLWQPASGRQTALPSGGGTKLSFSPDQALLAGVSNNNRVNIWSVASGDLLASWSDSRQPNYSSLVFSPDGTHLLTAGVSPVGEGAYVWDVGRESRSPQQVAAVIACKSAWHVEGERLVPQTPHPASCATGTLPPAVN